MAIDGTYHVTQKTPMGNQKSTWVLKTDGESLSGSMSDAKASAECADGKVKGNDFEFTSEVKVMGNNIKITFTGTVDGDKITGTAKSPMGNMPIEGSRA